MDHQTAGPDPTRPSIRAAVVMLALEGLRERGIEHWPQSPSEAIELLGAGRSHAYEMLGRIEDIVGSLCRRPGRPPSQEAPDAALAVTRAVRDFVFAHPHTVATDGTRGRYSDAFRQFVLALRTPGAIGHELAREPFAAAVGIPSDTLDDWTRVPVPIRPLRDRQRRQPDRVSQGPPSPRDPGRMASGRPAEPRQVQQGYPPSGASDR